MKDIGQTLDTRTYSSPAVERAAAILGLLREHPDGLSLSEITNRLKISKSTCNSILASLLRCRFVERHAHNRQFLLGPRLFELAQGYVRRLNIIELFKPISKELVAEVGETVSLGILEGNDALYIATQECDQPIRPVSEVGKRVPAHCSSVGKIMLAQLSAAELAERYRNDNLEKLTPLSFGDLATLKENLAVVKAQGYADSPEECALGLYCMAVPVRDYRNQVVAAMSVSAPIVRMSPDRVLHLRTSTMAAATRLSRMLGCLTD